MNRQLVVAFVTDAIFPFHHGGKESRYHELSQRLSAEFDVHVYTMHWWKGRSRRSAGAVELHSIAPRVPLYTRGRRWCRPWCSRSAASAC
jgi:hypothetical protein